MAPVSRKRSVVGIVRSGKGGKYDFQREAFTIWATLYVIGYRLCPFEEANDQELAQWEALVSWARTRLDGNPAGLRPPIPHRVTSPIHTDTALAKLKQYESPNSQTDYRRVQWLASFSASATKKPETAARTDSHVRNRNAHACTRHQSTAGLSL